MKDAPAPQDRHKWITELVASRTTFHDPSGTPSIPLFLHTKQPVER